MKKFTIAKSAALTSVLYILAIVGIVALVNSCRKSTCTPHQVSQNIEQVNQVSAIPLQQYSTQTNVVTVAIVRKAADGITNQVMFNELAELFTVTDATLIAGLQDALANNKTIKITFDPWKAIVLQINTVTSEEAAMHNVPKAAANAGVAYNIDLANTSAEVINHLPEIAVVNTTTPQLTDVIPDMATAQLIFDYIAHQCCAIPGPYGIDHCIPFQYCEDGCYARAHKMCWILNTKYNYATHKIFSFANAGSDQLSVKAEKWRGCCINWWYHVAPLVNIKSGIGTKAYVFDPAMFDQPVLLATWLHAQQNPACSSTPHVSMINIQPTSSYEPTSGSGLTFNTDPTFSATNGTLVSYSSLVSCP